MPPEPVVETVYWPGVAEIPTVTFRIVTPGVVGVIETLDALRTVVIPAGVLGAVKLTDPENPFRLDTVSVDVLEDPWFVVRLDGLAVVLNRGDLTMKRPNIGPKCMKHQ